MFESLAPIDHKGARSFDTSLPVSQQLRTATASLSQVTTGCTPEARATHTKAKSEPSMTWSKGGATRVMARSAPRLLAATVVVVTGGFEVAWVDSLRLVDLEDVLS